MKFPEHVDIHTHGDRHLLTTYAQYHPCQQTCHGYCVTAAANCTTCPVTSSTMIESTVSQFS